MKSYEIAYLMPTKYKIFVSKGEGTSPLDPYEHLTHRLSFPQFKMECPDGMMPMHKHAQRGRATPPFLMTVGEKIPCENGTNWEFITK